MYDFKITRNKKKFLSSDKGDLQHNLYKTSFFIVMY